MLATLLLTYGKVKLTVLCTETKTFTIVNFSYRLTAIEPVFF